MPQSGTIQANGIIVAYESYGPADRETGLLIAGTGNQLIDWPIELVEMLVERGYRVIRFDNRDVGLSTRFTEAGLPDPVAITHALQKGKSPPLPYTLTDMARDAVGLLDALHIQQAHIVGISMGGAIGQLIAIDFPDHTLSFTSLMADSGNPALPAVARPDAFAALPPWPADGDVEGYVTYKVSVMQALNSPSYPTDAQTLRARARRAVDRAYDPAGEVRQATVSLIGQMDGSYRLANLKNIYAPTVVLHGTDDPVVPVESARDIAARIPGAELRLIPGLGHEIPRQLVPAFADAITDAARRLC